MQHLPDRWAAPCKLTKAGRSRPAKIKLQSPRKWAMIEPLILREELKLCGMRSCWRVPSALSSVTSPTAEVQLTRLHNTGAAWSSFSGKTGLLAAVTVVLLAAVVYLVVKKIVRHPLGLSAAMLVLGGGIGNMIDRIFRGYVVDMFDLQFMDYPIFNLADIFVVVGVILGAVYYLWFYDKYDKRSGKEPGDDTAADSHK